MDASGHLNMTYFVLGAGDNQNGTAVSGVTSVYRVVGTNIIPCSGCVHGIFDTHCAASSHYMFNVK